MNVFAWTGKKRGSMEDHMQRAAIDKEQIPEDLAQEVSMDQMKD